jgi:hypothetical protein
MFGFLKKLFAPPLVEAPVVEAPVVYTADDLNKLTKLQLEELGREHGIELDRRRKKATLVAELLEVL